MTVCRISIQAEFDGESRAVDVAVSGLTTVGVLIPALVELLDRRGPADDGRSWRLDRLAGPPLDESMSLWDNDVHEGDVLVLSALHAPPLGPISHGPARAVAVAGAVRPVPERSLRLSACAWAMVIAAVTLVWAGTVTHSVTSLVVAACGAVVACWAGSSLRNATLAVVGALLAAAAGFLAVPAGPAAPNFFLCATAAFAVALVMTRMLERPSPALIATASSAALVGVTSACATFATLPEASVGAILATGAFGLASVAPRMALLSSGLGPRLADDPPDRLDARACAGQATLTGLIAGCAVSATGGVALVTLGCIRDEVSPVAGVAFAAVTSTVLLLRARTHVDAPRRIALVTAGMITAAAAFAGLSAADPGRAGWYSACVLAAAFSAIRVPGSTPLVTRAIDLLDYAVLAAVVPLACWVIGVYAPVRDWQFT